MTDTPQQDGLEQALARTEADAEAALRSAATLARELKRAKQVAATGALRDVAKAVEAARQLASAVVESVRVLQEGWDFDDASHLQSGAYTTELIRTAEEAGLHLVEQDGRLLGYPFVLRVLPAEAAVEVNRKRQRRLRPSLVVRDLIAQRDRPQSFQAARFLEALYAAYRLVLAEQNRHAGATVKLTDVYRVLTLMPGSERDYSKPEFARDINLLDESDARETKSGARVHFPAATGTKGSNALFTVSRSNELKVYYGTMFTQ